MTDYLRAKALFQLGARDAAWRVTSVDPTLNEGVTREQWEAWVTRTLELHGQPPPVDPYAYGVQMRASNAPYANPYQAGDAEFTAFATGWSREDARLWSEKCKARHA